MMDCFHFLIILQFVWYRESMVIIKKLTTFLLSQIKVDSKKRLSIGRARVKTTGLN